MVGQYPPHLCTGSKEALRQQGFPTSGWFFATLISHIFSQVLLANNKRSWVPAPSRPERTALCISAEAPPTRWSSNDLLFASR